MSNLDMYRKVNAEHDALGTEPDREVAPIMDMPEITLATASCLSKVSLTGWSGRVVDKEASDELAKSKNAKQGSAMVWKDLMCDCPQFKSLNKYQTSIRTKHDALTLPWEKNGYKLLPTARFIELNESVTGMIKKFEDEYLPEFLAVYEDTIIRMQLEYEGLGKLFRIEDYPTLDQVRAAFSVKLFMKPMPGSGDFRLDIGNEANDAAREYCKQAVAHELDTALTHIWETTRKHLDKMIERLDYTSKEDSKIFHDTLVSNITDIIGLLETFKDISPDAVRMQDQLRRTIHGVSPDALRNDERLRRDTSDKVKAAIAALPTLGIGA